MIINSKYNIGQVVYLRTDTEQKERLVTGIDIRQGYILYQLTYIDSVSYHYDFEIESERNTLKTLME